MVIDLYGLAIHCKAESSDFARELVRPFKFFCSSDSTPIITIVIEEQDPPYERFPELPASFSTPRNIVYKGPGYKVIDYFGKGVAYEEEGKSRFTLYSRDRNFLLEAFYLLVSSLFGQFCDEQGWLRIHALALAYKNRAILLPLPPGGGKSSMAFSLLQEDGFTLISDDEPILDTAGRIRPFPLRIGTLNKNKIAHIPKKFVYEIDRMEFGLKYFVDCDYWGEKIERRSLSDTILFVSKRVLNGQPRIEKTSKINALRSLVRDAVVGVGLYQGLEFIFRNSAWEIFSKLQLVFRRFVLALRLTLKSDTYQIIVTRDMPGTIKVLKEFVSNL